MIFVTFVGCLFFYSFVCFIRGEFSWQCCKPIKRLNFLVIGNLWGIIVTGGIGYISFYSVLVIIDNNSPKSEVKEDPSEKPPVKGIPKIDPSFMMDRELQRGSEMWLPCAYFACNMITTLLLKQPLM